VTRWERQSSNVAPHIESGGLVSLTDGKAHSLTRFRPSLVNEEEPSVTWADYPRIKPGDYPAYCKKAHWYWEPGFKRWTCILWFVVLGEDLHTPLGKIPMWINGGNAKNPHAGRRGRYLLEWVKANGGPPARRDRLPPRVFAKRMARVRVADTTSGVGSVFS